MRVDRVRLHARRMSLALLTVFFFSMLVSDCAEAVSTLSQMVARRGFLLTGDVTLSYEREWSDYRDQATSQFIHDYQLTLDGFIRDPRLALFEVSGRFSQALNDPGINQTYYGIATRLSLLNQRVLRGPLRYFPQPIQLRLSYNSAELSESHGYGLSLRYDFPGKALAFFRNGKFLSIERWPPRGGDASNNNSGDSAGSSGRLLPLPVLVFDYDSYTTKNEQSGGEQQWDYLSFRAETSTRTSQYRLEYRNNTTTDSGSGADVEFKSQFLDFRADYHFEDRKAGKTLDIYNLLSYQKFQDAGSMNLSSSGIWVKKFGQSQRDSLSVSGSGRYLSAENATGYGGTLSSSYTKNFSERLTNVISATLGYGKIENDSASPVVVGDTGIAVQQERNESDYSALVFDTVTYQFSQRLQLTGSVTAGVKNGAQEYGLVLGMSTLTRPAVAASYAYHHFGGGSDVFLEEDTRDTHRVSLHLRSRLPWGLYFLSRNYYQILNSEQRGKETQLRLRGDLFWNYGTYRFNLGVVHTSREGVGRLDSDISVTQVRAILSKSFSRRLFLFGKVYYATTSAGSTTIQFEPSLTWIYRKISLTSSYTLSKMDSDDVSRTDHRFYFTLTRYFAQSIRPFL